MPNVISTNNIGLENPYAQKPGDKILFIAMLRCLYSIQIHFLWPLYVAQSALSIGKTKRGRLRDCEGCGQEETGEANLSLLTNLALFLSPPPVGSRVSSQASSRYPVLHPILRFGLSTCRLLLPLSGSALPLPLRIFMFSLQRRDEKEVHFQSLLCLHTFSQLLLPCIIGRPQVK